MIDIKLLLYVHRVRDDRIARVFKYAIHASLGRSVLVADLAAGEAPQTQSGGRSPARDTMSKSAACCAVIGFVRCHITSDAYRVIPLLPDSQHSAGIPPLSSLRRSGISSPVAAVVNSRMVDRMFWMVISAGALPARWPDH